MCLFFYRLSITLLVLRFSFLKFQIKVTFLFKLDYSQEPQDFVIEQTNIKASSNDSCHGYLEIDNCGRSMLFVGLM